MLSNIFGKNADTKIEEESMEAKKPVFSKYNPELFINVYKGHFASDRFHTNYYLDMNPMKIRQKTAKLAADAMAAKYIQKVNVTPNIFMGENYAGLANSMAQTKPIDTILCLDGCELMGAYVAETLSKSGITTNNFHHSFNVMTPEFDASGTMVVRDAIKDKFKGKNVLIILATAMHGMTIKRVLKTVEEYGGNILGISVIFSLVDEIEGHPVNSIFTSADLPDFKLVEEAECEACKNKEPLDGIINHYGLNII